MERGGAERRNPTIKKMKTLRRIDLRQRLYFITAVTDYRQELLLNDINIFWQSWDKQDLDAWVIFPEHFHVILANGDKSISEILHRFKRKYSTRFAFKFGTAKVWQKRFWDHIIRDERDYYRHLNYIHFNPVRHGLVTRAHDYPHSSIRKFADWFPPDWGLRPMTWKEILVNSRVFFVFGDVGFRPLRVHEPDLQNTEVRVTRTGDRCLVLRELRFPKRMKVMGG